MLSDDQQSYDVWPTLRAVVVGSIFGAIFAVALRHLGHSRRVTLLFLTIMGFRTADFFFRYEPPTRWLATVHQTNYVMACFRQGERYGVTRASGSEPRAMKKGIPPLQQSPQVIILD